MGAILDLPWLKRRHRGFLGLFILLATCISVFTGNWSVTRRYTRESVLEPDFDPVDVSDDRFKGLVWLYIFNGCFE